MTDPITPVPSEAPDPAPDNGPRFGRYRVGDDQIDQMIVDLIAEAGPTADAELVFELVASAIRMQREQVGRRELKIANYTMKEMRYSFHVFQPYADRPKVSVFGSARTRIDDAAYRSAHDFSERIAERGWMVITGAGPGIMQAGIEGAGRENSFGVSIQLPFEQVANSVIAGDPKLINFRYFFTRKLSFMKESAAFCLLPGGFGTMDETFELLTLLQTGKSYPAPVVLLDTPGSEYWKRFMDFVVEELLADRLINEEDLGLVHLTDDIDDAVDHIVRFFRNYHSMRYVGRSLVLRHQHRLTDEQLVFINENFSDLLVPAADGGTDRAPGFSRAEPSRSELADDDALDLHRLRFAFNQHSNARLRILIDHLNDLVP